MPADRQNTWRFGFDRLLLGYAMGNNSKIFSRILPCEDIEGQGADLLGRFICFCETFFDTALDFSVPCSIDRWQERVAGLLDKMFLPDSPQAWQLQKIRDAMVEMVTQAGDVGVTKMFGLAQLELLGSLFAACCPCAPFPLRLFACWG